LALQKIKVWHHCCEHLIAAEAGEKGIAGGIFAFENNILTRADAKTKALPGFSAAPIKRKVY